MKFPVVLKFTLFFVATAVCLNSYAVENGAQKYHSFAQKEELQLAAGLTVGARQRATKRTQEAKASYPESKPYEEVELNISTPVATKVNKPAIVVFSFKSPVHGFSRDVVQVTNGSMIHFSSNSHKNMYLALVTADTSLDAQNSPAIGISVPDAHYGILSSSVRILFDEVDAPYGSTTGTSFAARMYFSIMASRGGDTVDAEDKYKIGNMLGIQIGFSLPVPLLESSLGQFIPDGRLRLALGYDQFKEGSENDGDRTTFSTITGDLLYDMRVSEFISIVTGMTVNFQGTLEAQSFRLQDFAETNLVEPQEGTVEFNNAYGFKFGIDYYPMGLSTVDWFVHLGVTAIKYTPSKIIFTGRGNEAVSNPETINANSIKLGIGVLI